MISLNGVTKRYNTPVVKDVSFHVDAGSTVALLGPNGAGKTTLLRILTSLTRCNAGTIHIAGEPVGRDNRNIKKRIGFMPQSINLESDLTVRENLILHGRLYGISQKEAAARARESLHRTALLERGGDYVRTLSGGMKRKLLLARALLHDPDILLLDEPTVGLDVPYRKTVWKLIREMHDQGKTVVVCTHYLEEAEQVCETVALLDKGELKYYGKMDDLFQATGRYAVEDEQNELVELFLSEEDAGVRAQQGNHLRLRKTDLEDIFIHLIDTKNE